MISADEYTSLGRKRLTHAAYSTATVCGTCGKTFYRSPEWAYKLGNMARPVFFCSYSCFRVKDKQEREKKRDRLLSQFGYDAELEETGGRDLTRDEERLLAARARVDTCNQKIEHYLTKASACPAGSREKINTLNTLYRWTGKLNAAMTAVTKIEKEVGAQKCTIREKS